MNEAGSSSSGSGSGGSSGNAIELTVSGWAPRCPSQRRLSIALSRAAPASRPPPGGAPEARPDSHAHGASRSEVMVCASTQADLNVAAEGRRHQQAAASPGFMAGGSCGSSMHCEPNVLREAPSFHPAVQGGRLQYCNMHPLCRLIFRIQCKCASQPEPHFPAAVQNASACLFACCTVSRFTRAQCPLAATACPAAAAGAVLLLQHRRRLLHWCQGGSRSSVVWPSMSGQTSCPAAACRCRLVPAKA